MPEITMDNMNWESMDLDTFEAELDHFSEEADGRDYTERYPHFDHLKFSVALSPYANYDFYRLPRNVAILKKLAPHIFDIIFTARVAPFSHDAHLVVVDDAQAERHLYDMLYIQEHTGITVSPVFNNIYTPNHRQALEQFVAGFRRYYDLGIRSVTLPHTLWMKFGLLQQEFPDLYIKNTILRECKTAQDFWNFAQAGFRYVNVDRRLMRDLDALKTIRRAQARYQERYGQYVVISMLTNEGCRGDCPFWAEHYQHNLFYDKAGNETTDSYVNVPPRFSCQQSRYTESDNNWRAVTLPILKEDLNAVAEFVDVIKLPGRAFDENVLYQQINNILAVKYNDQPVIDRNMAGPFYATLGAYASGQLEDPALAKKVDQWRQVTRSCGFQCWDCQLCEEVKGMALRVHQVGDFLTAAQPDGPADADPAPAA